MSFKKPATRTGSVPNNLRLVERFGLVASSNPHLTESLAWQKGQIIKLWPFVAAVGTILALVGFLTSSQSTNSVVSAFGLLIAVCLPLLASHSRLSQRINVQTFMIFLSCATFATALCGTFVASDGAQASSSLMFLPLAFAVLIVAPRIPVALIAFGFGHIIALLITSQTLPIYICASIEAVLFGSLAVVTARQELEQASAQQNIAFSADRSNRLIKEFEENGPGWFWETDADGNFVYVSPKLCRGLRLKGSGLLGQPLTSLASATPVEADLLASPQRSLAFYLTSRTTFSDLAISAQINGEARWWSVSGRPQINAYGQFRGFVGSGSDLTEQRRTEAERTRLARFDSLTGLSNRSETSALLADAMTDAYGRSRPCGLMMIDLDRFKSVNDTMGHPAGDELLKQVAHRLTKAVGTLGHVGRLGGDEFKVVFPNVDQENVLSEIAGDIISSISAPYFINESLVSIGASIGIAVSPHQGRTPDEIVRNADLALYAAKEAGRGRFFHYQSGMHSAAEERREIEEEMRQAVGRGEFHLVYQPIVSISTETVIGFESLVRWNHPTRGNIPPSVFIPIAEEARLIEPLGEWILRAACAEAATWPVKARVAVNVSPIQFSNPNFPALVSQALSQSGLSANRLELEITESVFLAGDETTDRQFAALKSLGIRLALDDFGTGYSSLAYLQRAPFDKIKIDQSFVRGAALGENRNAAIIKAIVTLAETVNMETTVEGVETHDEVDLVRNLGCSHIQGYVYGRPMPAADVLEKMVSSGATPDRSSHKKSRKPRFTVLRLAELTLYGRRSLVRIRNISTHGASFECSYSIAEGANIRLSITDGPNLSGVVKWSGLGRVGVEFDQAFDLQLLNQPMSAAS